MINLKNLLKKESKQTITEQPIGSYMRYVKVGLDRDGAKPHNTFAALIAKGYKVKGLAVLRSGR